MEHILITGASGYLGQHLVYHLCRDVNALAALQSNIYYYDGGGTNTNSNSANNTNEDGPPPGCNIIVTAAYHSCDAFAEVPLPKPADSTTGHYPHIHVRRVGGFDLTSFESVSRVFREAQAVSPVTIVVHLAALSRVADCEFDPEFARSVNCPTDTLWPALLDGSDCHSLRQIIFLSSDQVYRGDQRDAPYAETDTNKNPLNVYGTLKLKCERELLCEFDYSNTTSVYILRSGIMLGPRAPLLTHEHHVRDTFLQFVRRTVLAQEAHEYLTDEIRSAVHVHDVVRTICFFLNDSEAACCSSGIYNLGGGPPQGVSQWDMAHAVARRCAVSEPDMDQLLIPSQRFTEPTADREQVDRRKYHWKSPPNTTMDTDKLFQATGYKLMTLEQIVEQVFDEHGNENNNNDYGKVADRNTDA